MKLRNIHTTSLQGFKYPVSGQASWPMINDAEYVHNRGIHI